MTLYQLYMRFNHTFTAAHWRGYAVHSPMMYRFIRQIVMRNRRRDLCSAIVRHYGADRVAVIDTMEGLYEIHDKDVALIRDPFLDKRERHLFNAWYQENQVVVAHLQGLIVLFFDPGLQKQYFKIRN